MLDCLVGVFLKGVYELDLANISAGEMREGRWPSRHWALNPNVSRWAGLQWDSRMNSHETMLMFNFDP